MPRVRAVLLFLALVTLGGGFLLVRERRSGDLSRGGSAREGAPGLEVTGGEQGGAQGASPSPLLAGTGRGERAAPRDGAPRAGAQGETLEGVVVDQEGTPITGAVLRLHGNGIISALARSDDRGQFKFQDLPESGGTLTCRKGGWCSVSGMEVEVPGPGPIQVVMTPDRPGRLRVVGGEGSPLAGATIVARPESQDGKTAPGEASRAMTRPDGRAELSGLPCEDGAAVAVTVRHPGRPPALLLRTAGQLREAETTVVMPAGGTVAGLVVDSRGEPEPNVRLTLARADAGPGDLLSTPAVLHSTSSGAFRFTGLPEGEHTLFADGGTRGRRRMDGIRPAGDGSGDLRLELAPLGTPEAAEALPPAPKAVVRPLRRGNSPRSFSGGTIRGTVMTDSPIPSFAIGLVPEEESGEEPARVFRQSALRGDFRVENVPPGTYRVLLLVEGEERARAEGVTVAAGAESGPVELSLE